MYLCLVDDGGLGCPTRGGDAAAEVEGGGLRVRGAQCDVLEEVVHAADMLGFEGREGQVEVYGPCRVDYVCYGGQEAFKMGSVEAECGEGEV